MAEYIERERLLRHLDEQKGTPPEMCYTFAVIESVQDFVKNQPPADVAPVVHGQWDTNTDPGEEIKDFHCSVCEYLLCDIDTACMIPGENDFYFCPNCGAKMDLE